MGQGPEVSIPLIASRSIHEVRVLSSTSAMTYLEAA